MSDLWTSEAESPTNKNNHTKDNHWVIIEAPIYGQIYFSSKLDVNPLKKAQQKFNNKNPSKQPPSPQKKSNRMDARGISMGFERIPTSSPSFRPVSAFWSKSMNVSSKVLKLHGLPGSGPGSGEKGDESSTFKKIGCFHWSMGTKENKLTWKKNISTYYNKLYYIFLWYANIKKCITLTLFSIWSYILMHHETTSDSSTFFQSK